MTQDSLDYSKTYIAFDSGCGECSAISHSLEQETNGKLLARPLSDPEVEQIRINHFGPNPPHIPVAITFNRTTPKVYSGPRLVALMARRFGPTTSLLLARIIGVYRNNEHLAFTTPHAERRFFSRRAALQSAAGLAAVATIATIHTRVGSGVAHALEPKPLKSKTSGLDQPSIDELMQELSEDSNTRAALAALDLDLATSLPRSTAIAQKGLRGKEATEAGQRPDAPEAMQSEFARTSFSDGSTGPSQPSSFPTLGSSFIQKRPPKTAPPESASKYIGMTRKTTLSPFQPQVSMVARKSQSQLPN